MENTKQLFFELEKRTTDLRCAKDLINVFLSFLDDECPVGDQEKDAWRCTFFASRTNLYRAVLNTAFEKVAKVDAAIEELIMQGLSGKGAGVCCSEKSTI